MRQSWMQAGRMKQMLILLISTFFIMAHNTLGKNVRELEPFREELRREPLVSVKDYYNAAKKLFVIHSRNEDIWNSLEDGSELQWTQRQNRRVFQRWVIRPRYLRDVSQFDTSTTILGKPISFPIAVGPSGMHGDFHQDAELATSRAAQQIDTIFGLSCTSTVTMEEVAKSTPNLRKWMQVETYRNQTEVLIQKAEALGFEAIVVTIDSPTYGNIYAMRKQKEREKDSKIEVIPAVEEAGTLDPSATWDLIPWIRERTHLKLILKGIMTKEDAAIAAALGVDAIIVSNHGGRHLDSVLPTLDALPEVVEAVGDKVEVYMDGGVTLGSDAFKAIALGARMVLVGRAALWGLSVGGQEGTYKVLNILKEEFERTMRLSGHKNVKEITRAAIQAYSPLTSENCL